MKKKPALRSLYGAILLAASMPFAACSFDDAYDLDKDIDLTMGLGAEGLQLKIGSTEQIHLSSLLDESESVQTDVLNRYYLKESGHTSVNFSIGVEAFKIDNARLKSVNTILSYDDIYNQLVEETGLPVDRVAIPVKPQTFDPQAFTGESKYDFEVRNIGAEVKELHNVNPDDDAYIHLNMHLEQGNLGFSVEKLANVRINFPSYIKVESLDEGRVTVEKDSILVISNALIQNGIVNLGSARIKAINMPDAEKVIGSDHLVNLAGRIKMSGTMTVAAAREFDIAPGQAVYAQLDVEVGAGNIGQQSDITVESVKGVFAPAIAPDNELIDISEELPDFLKDDAVTIAVANPTIKFEADMLEIPADISMTAAIDPMFNGAADTDNTAVLTRTTLKKQANNIIYFCQESTPYDPTGEMATGATVVGGQQLSQLIKKLPDAVQFRMNGNDAQGKPMVSVVEEPIEIKLGYDYDAAIAYDVCVPFTFNKGLTIVYNDSVDDMNKDLKDYAAEGIVISGTAVNAIPLDLLAEVTPVGLDGQPLPGIKVTNASIKAATMGEGVTTTPAESPITLDITLQDPNDLKKLDKLRFRITADNQTDGVRGELCSDQYLSIKDLRLKLKGKVTANFN